MTNPQEIKPLLGIPLERTIPATAFQHFIPILAQGWAVISLPYVRTDMARNRMAEMLLKSEATHLVMLDVDHHHPPDIVHRLLRWLAVDDSKWIVGGLNARRTPPHDPMAMIKGDDGAYYQPLEWADGLTAVDILGTGCIAIDRRVFEQLSPPWFWYDYSGIANDQWPSEDIAFSKAVRAAGIQLWCDASTTSPHLIDKTVSAEDFKDYWYLVQDDIVEVKQTITEK